MNINRLTQLAEWLEGGAKHERFTFDMTTGIAFPVTEEFNPDKVTDCGVACCIAGAACQFFGDPTTLIQNEWLRKGELHLAGDHFEVDWKKLSTQAMFLLGLTEAQATALFTPNETHRYRMLREFNDPAWAARTIRRLIETGEVDWMASR